MLTLVFDVIVIIIAFCVLLKVRFGGTVRAFSDETMQHLKSRLAEVVASQAQVWTAYGVERPKIVDPQRI